MPSDRKLLIVGINYAPEETGIGPYTTGLAEHMAAQGWRVTVVTGMPHYPRWKVESEYRRKVRVRESRAGVDVRRSRHFVPGQQSVSGRGLYEATFFTQAVTNRSLTDANCVLGVVPSLGGGAAAALLARRCKAPLGIIFQDLVGQAAAQSGLPGGGRAARPVRSLERWVARRADGVAIAAEGFRSYVESAGTPPERIVHLPNWSHTKAPTGSVSAVRQAFGWATDQQVVLHAGNIGYKQGLENLISAARLAHGRCLPIKFVLMGHGAERKRLEGLANGLSNVQFLDPQPGDTFMDVLAAADVLLLNERPSVLDMSLPSKITSYFGAGRPVVAAVPDEGSTARELSCSGGALITAAGDPAGILAAVHRLAADPALAADLVRRGHLYATAQFDAAVILKRFEEFIVSLSRASDRGAGRSTATRRRSGAGHDPQALTSWTNEHPLLRWSGAGPSKGTNCP